MLIGLEKPVQIVQMGASVSEILNMAALAAIDSMKQDEKEAANKKKVA